MSAPVTLARRGAIAVVTIDHPPVNAAGQAVRAGLCAAAAEIAADPAIRGAVLVAAGRTFVAGADVTEFGKPAVAPSLRETLAAIEALTKPVLAVLHGTTLGGGFELALSCRFRVIDPAGAVGLPEVTLGIIPGAGGTQRLPRLAGFAVAMDLIASGRRLGAEDALRLGLVDAITRGDRLAFAIDVLEQRLGESRPSLSSSCCPPADPDLVASARKAAAQAAPGQIAPQRAIDVLDASAGLSFAEGMALERATFETLVGSPQARALRHIFFAERTIAKGPGPAAPRSLDRIGVVGGGTMGAGIAAACLLAGLPACLVERDDAARAAGEARVAAILAEAVRRKKLSVEQHATIQSQRFITADTMEALAEADLVIEAVFESLAVKQEVFRALDRVAKPGAVLATNTSYLDVAAIAAATRRPQDVIGLHFFSPAHIMKLVEVVVPDGAAPEAVATGFALGKRLGKLAVRTGNSEGFIGNRILSAYRRAADHMVEDGASPWDVDAAFRSFGFPMGVYQMQDLSGLDIGWATRKRLAPTRDPAERYVRIADRLCEQGRFGRKTGRGFYRYGEGAPVPDPEVDVLVEEERRAKGIVPRFFSAEAIQTRILLAMANEGAQLLGEGVALRASDIDVVMVAGYGFPRWRGGPMHQAEVVGLPLVLAQVRALQDEDPLWTPAPLLTRAALRWDN